MEKEQYQIKKELRFKSIYQETFDKLNSLFLRSFKDQDLVHDALQEGYLKLWEKLEDQEEGQDCTPFLFFYTRNYALKQISRNIKRELLEEDIFRGGDSVNMEAELEYKEYRLQLRRIIADLPNKRREVFQLFNDEGLSYRSIGAKLQISSKTVDNHLSKATKTIKKEIFSIYGLGIKLVLVLLFL